MTCASCEERAKMLKQARDAFYRGDLAEANHLLKGIFGTALKDVTNLGAAIIRPGGPTREQIEAADPNAERGRKGTASLGLFPDHEHKHDH